MEGVEKAADRIALFGGSFNPPHAGHAEVLRYLAHLKDASGRERFAQVWLLVTHVHAFGKELADFATRRRLCELLIEDLGSLGKHVRVCDIEEKLPGESRTIQTLRELQKLHPNAKFTLVLGADLKSETSRWLSFAEIEKMVDILYVPRRGFAKENQAIAQEPFAPEISSTKVRGDAQRSGINPQDLTPRVWDYIRKNHLYGKG